MEEKDKNTKRVKKVEVEVKGNDVAGAIDELKEILIGLKKSLQENLNEATKKEAEETTGAYLSREEMKKKLIEKMKEEANKEPNGEALNMFNKIAKDYCNDETLEHFILITNKGIGTCASRMDVVNILMYLIGYLVKENMLSKEAIMQVVAAGLTDHEEFEENKAEIFDDIIEAMLDMYIEENN